MNRRGFITNLFRVSAAIVIAPVMVAEVLPTTVPKGPMGLWEQMQASNIMYYEQFSLEDLEKVLTDLSNRSLLYPRETVCYMNPNQKKHFGFIAQNIW